MDKEEEIKCDCTDECECKCNDCDCGCCEKKVADDATEEVEVE